MPIMQNLLQASYNVRLSSTDKKTQWKPIEPTKMEIIMELIKFPSIVQFHAVVKYVRDRAKYHETELPKLKFNGSVKLHGTNAAIVRDLYSKETWAQSRENVITVEQDNAGFARFVSECQYVDLLFAVAATVYGHHRIQAGDRLAIYGEWCGGSIQKKVALNQLPKMFVIFGIRVSKDEEHSVWFTPQQLVDFADGCGRELPPESMIFSIQKFQTWEVEIDFSNPADIQNHLVELTTAVEQCCPVCKTLGVEGVGEGIVWRCDDKWTKADGTELMATDLIFKVKGEKHSDTKTKNLAPVDVEKVKSIKEFAERVTTDHRLEKMVELMRVDGVTIEPKSIPVFLKHVGNDVIKEESDMIDASGLTRKEVMSAVNAAARQWFLKMVNQVQ